MIHVHNLGIVQVFPQEISFLFGKQSQSKINSSSKNWTRDEKAKKLYVYIRC